MKIRKKRLNMRLLLIDHEVAPHFLHFNSSKVERLPYELVLCVVVMYLLSNNIFPSWRLVDKPLKKVAGAVHHYV